MGGLRRQVGGGCVRSGRGEQVGEGTLEEEMGGGVIRAEFCNGRSFYFYLIRKAQVSEFQRSVIVLNTKQDITFTRKIKY